MVLDIAVLARSFGRGKIAYDPWYVPILTRKPGALRNGAPFKGWQLPGTLGRIRARLMGCNDGDGQFVRILAAVSLFKRSGSLNQIARSSSSANRSRPMLPPAAS